MSDDMDERAWESGWDGHLQAQLQRMARLPLWEKIAWLEEAQRLAARLTAQRATASGERRDGGSDPRRPTDDGRSGA